jgi:hypothetical protein
MLGGLRAVVPGQSWPSLLLFLLGSAVTWLSKTAGELKPLADFFTERMKGERFRAMYFRFLSRTSRYAVAAPETVLRRAVLSVRIVRNGLLAVATVAGTIRPFVPHRLRGFWGSSMPC